MDYPQRIQQHKNESDSFAILHYKLKKLGIFRNMTESDYGIDFEIEVVNGTSVEGRTIKAQVKSSTSLNVRKDGNATISGIKHSTLNYWARLSYDVPVIGFAVDLSTEKIYVSDPLFLQSTMLIKPGDSSESIFFRPYDSSEGIVRYLHFVAYDYNLRGTIYALRWILRNMRKILEFYDDVHCCDEFMTIHEPDLFRTFLENLKEIVVFAEVSRLIGIATLDKKLYSYQYYVEKGQDPTPYNIYVYQGLENMLPILFAVLSELKRIIENSFYYWLYNDVDLLNLVCSTVIPTDEMLNKLEHNQLKLDDYWQSDDFDNSFRPLIEKCETHGVDEGEVMNVLREQKGSFYC